MNASAPEKDWPPKSISATEFALDDCVFTPTHPGRIERATRGGYVVGDVLLDLIPDPADKEKAIERWMARKIDPLSGDLCDWKPMRCVHEARAFVVSRIRT